MPGQLGRRLGLPAARHLKELQVLLQQVTQACLFWIQSKQGVCGSQLEGRQGHKQTNCCCMQLMILNPMTIGGIKVCERSMRLGMEKCSMQHPFCCHSSAWPARG